MPIVAKGQRHLTVRDRVKQLQTQRPNPSTASGRSNYSPSLMSLVHKAAQHGLLLRRRRQFAPSVMAVPAVLLLLTFIFAPLAYTIIISFMHWDLISAQKSFAGVSNYRDLWSTPGFLQSLATTAGYGGLFLLVVVPGGFLLAKAVDTKLPGMGLARSVIFMPYVIPLVAAAVAWEWMFEQEHGLLPKVFEALGLGSPAMLSGRWTAPLAIEIVFIWQYIGFYMLIFLSGLQGLDNSLAEAARVDGASPTRIVRHVELPQLRPVVLFTVVFALVQSFQLFDQIYVMTQGGPGTATFSIVYWLYTQAFQFFDIGSAAAGSVMLMAILALLTWIVLRVGRERTSGPGTVVKAL